MAEKAEKAERKKMEDEERLVRQALAQEASKKEREALAAQQAAAK